MGRRARRAAALTPEIVAWGAGGAVLGLIAGSFVATLVLRMPAGRGMGGRSACDGCGIALRPDELAPLFSYLLQRGRCRRCGAAIDRAHPVIEAACGATGAAAFLVAPGIEGAFGALFGWLLIALAALDLRHMWLPDVLTGALVIIAAVAAACGIAPEPLDRLIGGAAGFASLALVAAGYRWLRGREGMGGGDPKLLGAIGLWLGWAPLPFVLLGASGLGLAVALVMRLRGQAVGAATRLPLGALLAVAALSAWVFSR